MIIKRVIIEAVTKDIALKQKTSKDDEISFPFKINSLSQLFERDSKAEAENAKFDRSSVNGIIVLARAPSTCTFLGTTNESPGPIKLLPEKTFLEIILTVPSERMI